MSAVQYFARNIIVSGNVTIGSEYWHFDLDVVKSLLSIASMAVVWISLMWVIHLNEIGTALGTTLSLLEGMRIRNWYLRKPEAM